MAATDDIIITVACSGPGAIPLLAKTSYNMVKLTAGNFAAQNTKVVALTNAYLPLTNGIVRSTNMVSTNSGSQAYPTPTANRGQKWIVTSTNATSDVFTHTIPAASALTADLTSDNLTANLTSTNWAAYASAFTAIATSPSGDTLTIVRAKLGGRRR